MALNERDRHILSLLLEHPYLHDGLTSEAALNYLLGRTHSDRRSEPWRRSVRAFSHWLGRVGFESKKSGSVYRYHWVEPEE